MAKRKASPQTVASSFGTAALGLVLLIVGTVLKSHFQLNAAICNTYGGSTSHCVANSTAFTVGQVMQPIGGIMIGIGLIIGVLLLINVNSSSKSTVSSQMSGTPRMRTQADPSAKIIDTRDLKTSSRSGDQQPPVDDRSDW
jgi:hypothetical protein